MKKPFLTLILFNLTFGLTLPTTSTRAEEKTRVTPSQVIDQLNQLSKMREGLASSLVGRSSQDPITADTFQKVCAPVGKALREWASSSGVHAQQLATRFRNPTNQAQGTDAKLIQAWEKDPSQLTAVFTSVRDGKPGMQIVQRIPVAEGCLQCHGEKSSRPDFIQKKYINDQAHSFRVGDLRGIFSVWIPDES